MSRQRVLDLESEFHFLFSRSKASNANTGIIGISFTFRKKNSNGCRREASGTHTTGEYFLVTVFVDRNYIVCFQIVIRAATQCSVLRVKYAGIICVKQVFVAPIFIDLVLKINLHWPCAILSPILYNHPSKWRKKSKF